MKKRFFTIGFFALLAFPAISHAERISSFSGAIIINNDAAVQVVETITYDFEGSHRHGIYRDIPLRSSDGSYLEIKNVSVVDENGSPYQNKVSTDTSGLHIKIGDPDNFVSGIKTYKISYLVKNALVSFDDYDELYWNVTGNDWNVPIDRVSTTISSPQVVQSFCYQGPYGSKTPCDTKYKTTDLGNHEGMTIAVGFQKGIVFGIARKGGQTNEVYGPVPNSANSGFYQVVILIVGMLSLAGTFYYWWKNRDPKSQLPIVAWYESPNGLPPMVMGTLIDKKTDLQDITGQIISLASRGYVSLTRIEEKVLKIFTNVDYDFSVTKNTTDVDFEGDKKVLELLFGSTNPEMGTHILMSQLSNDSKMRIQSVLREAQVVTRDFLKADGYLEQSKKPWWTYIVGAVFIVLVYGAIKLMNVTDSFSLLLVPIGAICGFIWLSTKTKYTQRGVDVRQQVLGFKTFLSVTDKERFEFHNAPEKNPTQFMEFLPYAIALGVEKKWAQQFEGMMIPSPTWYHSNTASFVALDFASHMRIMNESLNSAATPASSGSGGGGSSGGGSGGGGGGSW